MENLSPEVTLLLVEVGEFDVMDGLAIRWTCQSLFKVSEHRAFWMAIACHVQKNYPLPIPSLRTLPSLSSVELMEICLNCERTRRNLQSDNPQIRRMRVLRMKNQRSPLANFSFLPGGRYVFTYHENGLVNLWDAEHIQALEAPGPWRDAAKGGDYRPLQVGRLLATCDAACITSDTNYHTYGEGDNKVLVVVTSQITPELMEQDPSCRICVFRFTLFGADRAEVESLYEREAHVINSMIAISNELTVFAGIWHGFVRLLVVDWTRSAQVYIDTGISHLIGGFETHLCGSDYIIYSCFADGITLAAYFNIARHLQGANINHSTVIPLMPDHLRTFPLEPLLSTRDWFTFTPFNTPNNRTSPRLTIVASGEQRRNRSKAAVLTVQHVDLQSFLRRLQDEVPGDDFPEITTRSVHSISPLALTTRQRKRLMTVGTCGKYLAYGTAQPITLEMCTLPSAGGSDWPALRTLASPLDLNRISMLEMCDEMGVLGLAVATRTNMTEQRIHLFDY